MDLGLTETQEMIRRTAREFFERECPTALVRQMEDDHLGYPPMLWQQMGELGWMGLAFPDSYGGSDGSLTDLAVLLEEMGRALVPSPFFPSVALAGLTILNAGSTAQQDEILPGLITGTLIATMALTEDSARYSAKGICMPASTQSHTYTLQGSKIFVEYAHVVDYLLVPVRTDSSGAAEEGITLLLLPKDSPGISLVPLHSLARDKQFQVLFDGVEVPKSAVVGRPGLGWDVVKQMLDRATMLHCAESVGGAQCVMEMTVEYAKQRVQFGRPIGSFQAVQHACADMVNAIDSARLAVYQAISKLEDGMPAEREISLAKVLTNHAYKWTTLQAQQIHGGIGFMEEYDLQLWTRRAKVAELKYGTSSMHRETFAASMGLRGET